MQDTADKMLDHTTKMLRKIHVLTVIIIITVLIKSKSQTSECLDLGIMQYKFAVAFKWIISSFSSHPMNSQADKTNHPGP